MRMQVLIYIHVCTACISVFQSGCVRERVCVCVCVSVSLSFSRRLVLQLLSRFILEGSAGNDG